MKHSAALSEFITSSDDSHAILAQGVPCIKVRAQGSGGGQGPAGASVRPGCEGRMGPNSDVL